MERSVQIESEFLASLILKAIFVFAVIGFCASVALPVYLIRR